MRQHIYHHYKHLENKSKAILTLRNNINTFSKQQLENNIKHVDKQQKTYTHNKERSHKRIMNIEKHIQTQFKH